MNRDGPSSLQTQRFSVFDVSRSTAFQGEAFVRRKYHSYFLQASDKEQFFEDLHDLFAVGLVTSSNWKFETGEERI